MSQAIPIRPVALPVDDGLVTHLEKLLREAKAGTLLGAIFFCNHTAGGYSHAQQGEIRLETALLALESWKFRMLATRELEHNHE